MFNTGYRMLGAGARGWSRETEGERSSGLGTHVHPWLIHVNVWQNQYSIVKQNKVKIKIKKKRTSFLGVSSERSCRSSKNHLISASGQSMDLDYCDIEWFALEMNRDHSVVFEIAFKYCISDSFVDYEGYSISSKGFLPTIVNILVIWIKSPHSGPF